MAFSCVGPYNNSTFLLKNGVMFDTGEQPFIISSCGLCSGVEWSPTHFTPGRKSRNPQPELNACSNSGGYRPKQALLNMGRPLSLGVYEEMTPYGIS
jgi:hypothetical protein